MSTPNSGDAKRWFRRSGEQPSASASPEELAEAADRQARAAEAAASLRISAEKAAAEQAAERLVAEEAAAEAARLRAEAESRVDQLVIDRQAIESSIRHHTELVETTLQERLAAERRAAELARELADLREKVLATIKEKGSKRSIQALELAVAAGTSPASVDSGVPAPAAPAATSPAPEPRAQTKSAWALAAELAQTGQIPKLTPDVLRTMDENAGSLPSGGPVAEPVETRPAEDIRSFTPENKLGLLTAGEVTVSDQGVLDVRKGSRSYRFDLYDTATEIKMTARPSSRRWKVEFRAGDQAVSVDAKMVDAEAFTRELVRWRPELGG